MKTRNNVFLTGLLIAIAVLISQNSFAQEINTNRIQVKKGIPDAPVVNIKVYNNPNGSFTLLAYNPNEHNLAFYDNEDYTLTWLREGRIMPTSGAFINNVCGDLFQVLVLDKRTGMLGKARIHNLPCPIEDRLAPRKSSIE